MPTVVGASSSVSENVITVLNFEVCDERSIPESSVLTRVCPDIYKGCNFAYLTMYIFSKHFIFQLVTLSLSFIPLISRGCFIYGILPHRKCTLTVTCVTLTIIVIVRRCQPPLTTTRVVRSG